MAKAPPPHQDFVNDLDEDLVFDDPEPNAANATSAKPRRVKRGQAKTTGSASPADTPASWNAGVPSIPAASAEQAVANSPSQAAPSRPQPWLLAIVALALLTSLISLGGLLMVSRTLGHAEAERENVRAEHEMLARVPVLVERLDQASRRMDEAAGRLATASPSGAPATVAEIRHELDALKLALADHQPDGVAALNNATREGFSELGTKLDRLSDRLDRTGGVSASRPASPATYRGRPS